MTKKLWGYAGNPANSFHLIFETIAGGIDTCLMAGRQTKLYKPTGKPKLTDILMEGISDGLSEVLKLLFV
ncbi:MAG: hypothetical protein Q7S43_04715 [bacterium]|nr:hypothetical protein [bacterium]